MSDRDPTVKMGLTDEQVLAVQAQKEARARAERLGALGTGTGGDRTATEEAAAEEVARRQATEKAPPPAAAFRSNPALLQQAFERFSTRASEGGGAPPALPRRRWTFVVSKDACEPGVFPEDFEITIQSLSADSEKRAINETGLNEQGMGMSLAKRSIVEVNGAPVGPGVLEWLWDALGTGGRTLVGGLYAQMTVPSAEVAGKAMGTLRKR